MDNPTPFVEPFPDDERQTLKGLVLVAIAHCPADRPAQMVHLCEVLSRLGGTDTVIVANRAYPSRGRKEPVT